MPAGARCRRLDVVLLCLLLSPACAFVSEDDVDNEHRKDEHKIILEHLQSYEITYPIWQHPPRHRRAASQEGRYPAEIQVVITAEGHEFTLHLQKNEQLLAPGYQEIWYSPGGARMSASPANTGHCLYHGAVSGMEGSSVALSTCSGLRGFISMNTSTNYLIEPLHNSTDPRQHAVFRAESVRLPSGRCLIHQRRNMESAGRLDDFISGIMSPWRTREKREVNQNTKYVELLLVADKAEFQKHKYDLDKTKLKLLEAANLVDKYYKTLNIRVALIGLEVWTTADMITVSDNPHSTLAAFLSWRRKQLRALPNDNAQLITGRSFQGTTIGLSPLKVMCSDYESGGVNTDHSESAVGVAATMAHEMGHNFGMTHDIAGCCRAKAEDGGCIMASATGHPFPRVFNECNLRELKSYLSSGGGKCLYNLPNTRAMYGGQRCGNGYLEDGEECDCGEEEECTSPCCNANNCTLKAGAECAHGVCCHDCKLKSPGVLCRDSSGPCDLPEYCDGKKESCPANYYLVDGTECASGKAYCYTGMCLTLQLQCQSIWGRDGRPAPDVCFNEVNKAGDMYGNCGKDLLGKYRSCTSRDAKCGKIQCSTSATKPMETNAVLIETTIKEGRRRIQCKGTHVYKITRGDEEPQSDTLDPGLVMTGTKCGQNSVCFHGECRNASFLTADQCNSKCHGHGLCNNNLNCHCHSGWAPPWCDQPGSGGSVDSGPVIGQNNLLLYLLPVFVALLAALAALGFWYHCRHKVCCLKTSAPPPPAKKCAATAEEKPVRAVNPTFLLKRQDSFTPQPSPGGPSRHRNAIVRPAVKPPPVPAYAAKQKEQKKQMEHKEQKELSPTAPAASSSSENSNQGQTTSDFKSNAVGGMKLNQEPLALCKPAPLNLQNLKKQSVTSPNVTKNRPDPPRRPPPPCPNGKSAVGQPGVNVPQRTTRHRQ